jgi:hypothetical protein
MKNLRLAFAVLALSAVSAPAVALDFTMDFDNIPSAAPFGGPDDPDSGSAVLGYYSGDVGTNPPFPRAGAIQWDTTFSPDALAICSFPQAGGDCQGLFPEAHSGVSAVGAIEATSFRFDVSPGLFVSKLSFWYNAGGSGSRPAVELFSGATSVFSQALAECLNPGQGGFCGWKEYQVPNDALFGKLITGVAFSNAPGKAVFDDVSVSTTPIPEPSTYALMLGGLALLAGLARRRAR